MWVRTDGASVYASYGPFLGRPGGGGVVALDPADGSELWRFQTEALAFPVVAAAGRAIFGTADGRVIALDATTGAEAWRAEVGGAPFWAVIAGDVVVVGDGQPSTFSSDALVDTGQLGGLVHALDAATRTQLWATTAGAGGHGVRARTRR